MSFKTFRTLSIENCNKQRQNDQAPYVEYPTRSLLVFSLPNGISRSQHVWVKLGFTWILQMTWFSPIHVYLGIIRSLRDKKRGRPFRDSYPAKVQTLKGIQVKGILGYPNPFLLYAAAIDHSSYTSFGAVDHHTQSHRINILCNWFGWAPQQWGEMYLPFICLPYCGLWSFWYCQIRLIGYISLWYKLTLYPVGLVLYLRSMIGCYCILLVWGTPLLVSRPPLFSN